MKNLIYQVWAGDLSEEAKVSSKLMKEYANRIGAEYLLDLNPNIASKICDVPMYFEWLNPILDDRFEKYNKILSVDLDVFPVENLTEDIFEEDVGDIGACTEPFQGKQRSTVTIGGHIDRKNDERWASVVKQNWGVTLPRDEDYNLKVYQFIRENGGWDQWEMILIEKYPCDDVDQARARERYWKKELNATLNTNEPGRTQKEWREDNKEILAEKEKQYRKDNKQIIAEKNGFILLKKSKLL